MDTVGVGDKSPDFTSEETEARQGGLLAKGRNNSFHEGGGWECSSCCAAFLGTIFRGSYKISLQTEPYLHGPDP